MALQPVEIIEGEIRTQLSGRAGGPDCVYAFSLTGPGGGDLFIRVAAGMGTVSRGLPPASDCHVTLATEDAVALVRGKLNPLGAFFSGRIKVSGDMGAAGRLGQLLRPR